MYKIEKTEYGVKLVFSGSITKEEMSSWVEESKKLMSGLPSKFGVFVDMRELKPLSSEAQKEMEAGQKLYKEKGMDRSVVIVVSRILSMQFKRIAKESGIYQWERYLSAEDTPDWEEKAIAWIKDAVDPDK